MEHKLSKKEMDLIAKKLLDKIDGALEGNAMNYIVSEIVNEIVERDSYKIIVNKVISKLTEDLKNKIAIDYINN